MHTEVKLSIPAELNLSKYYLVCVHSYLVGANMSANPSGVFWSEG